MEKLEFTNPFEIIGYNKDFYLDRRYIGSVKLTEPDREVAGVYGEREEVLQEDIILKKKLYKKGTVVITSLQTVCGKMKPELQSALDKQLGRK